MAFRLDGARGRQNFNSPLIVTRKAFHSREMPLGNPCLKWSLASKLAWVSQGTQMRTVNLLDLVADVADEDPFDALRLLQVFGVNKFGHILSAVPPNATIAFCSERDTTIADALGAIHGIPVDPDHSTHTLLVVAGGARFHSLRSSAFAS
jgi:hypothetical protein